MGEEGENVNHQNGDAGEMSPKDDGSKVPLASNDAPVKVEEAKFKKGDTEIDVGIPAKFTGLTKEELMKYSTDPFWVRLRMFLFALFWFIWAAMLVLAIVIIIKAPACAPPPELQWVEENAMIDLDTTNLPDNAADIEQLEKEMEDMDIKSAHLKELIDSSDFMEMKYNAQDLINSIVASSCKVVTDLPNSMGIANMYYTNATDEGLIDSDGVWNYSNPALPAAMMNYLSYYIDNNVTGFLMTDEYNSTSEDKILFREEMNKLLNEKGGAISGNLVNFEKEQQAFSPSNFNMFLEENVDFWSFYRFMPKVARSAIMNHDDVRLTTIGLFLFGGTPMLYNYDNLDNSTTQLIAKLSQMRGVNGIKLGNVNMLNTTTENVVAFTRTYKGTPAYAVALNFNDSNETISFIGSPNYAAETEGNIELDSTPEQNEFDSREKYPLDEVLLAPNQGIVVQFVGKF